jgi:hypothetical protein
MYFWSETSMKLGEKDTAMNYTKHLMNQTLSITSKLKDWHEQGT